MKHTIIYSAILAGILLTGCNSLEQVPSDRYTDSTYWTSVERAQYVLNMAYNQMYSHDKIWFDECLSDNLYEMRGNPDSRQIRVGTANASLGVFESEWRWIYQGIKTTNVFMDNIGLVPNMDSNQRTDMIAQIRFIRAYLYFRAVNFYGAIPFFLSDISLDESRASTRTPKSEIIPQLISELEAIIPDLPSRDELSAARNGEITKAAAMVLLARIYLYNGDLYSDNMTKVAEICDDLIHNQDEYGHYSLFNTAANNCSGYENLFMSAYEYNEEVILDYSAMETVKQWSFNYRAPITAGAALSQECPTRSLVDDYLMANGKAITESGSGYSSSDPYTNRDPRLLYTVACHGKPWKDRDNSGNLTSWNLNVLSGVDAFQLGGNSTCTGYYIRKYFDMGHGLELRHWNNIIMMRWADVLLMYAEAMQATGQFTSSVWDETIRPIRERAGMDATACEFPQSVTGDDMRDLIRRERRCELALEGLRYYDLLRWDLASTNLNGNIISSVETGNIVIDSFSYNSGRDALWSIPQSQLDLVPSLLPNNPGY